MMKTIMHKADNSAPTLAWPVALGATALLGSLATSCMFPFTAFAVLAAATLPLRRAIVVLIAAWALDQAIGFGFLGYPQTAFTALCGLGLLVSGLSALATARMVTLREREEVGPLSLVAAFALAFVAYEATLYFGATIIGGTETFATPIVLQVARNDATWFLALAVVWQTLRLAVPTWFARVPQYA